MTDWIWPAIVRCVAAGYSVVAGQSVRRARGMRRIRLRALVPTGFGAGGNPRDGFGRAAGRDADEDDGAAARTSSDSGARPGGTGA